MARLIYLFLLLLPLQLFAQGSAENIIPIGSFQTDTIKIGQEVQFSFYLRHPPEAEIVFPDSTYNFSPFEYMSRQYFPTRTIAGQSLDSVVYTLRTFAIDPVQSLSLPVYLLRQNDTLLLKSENASVCLKQYIKGPPLPENLKAQTELLPIEKRFNLAYWLIGGGIVLFLVGIIWLLFGKNLINRYRLYKLQKQHHAFINKYNAFIEQFNKSESLQTIEQAITLWKNYLTELEGNAINSFTTKEIAAYYNEDEDVSTALRLFDKAIYGNIVSDKSSETIIAFYLLHHFADRRYEVIKDQTSNVVTAENEPELV